MALWNKDIPRSEETKRKISEGLRKGKVISCYYCGKPIYKSPSQFKKYKRHFCSPNHQRFGLMGEEAWHWKADKASYKAIHQWFDRTYGKPLKCDHCGSTTAKVYDWANKFPFNYNRNRDEWMRLCRSCHMKYDKIYGGETRNGKFNIVNKIPFRK